MKISKKSSLLKVGALLAIAVVAWIPLTSACSSCDNDGQVCFYYRGPCQFPAGTKLCISEGTCIEDDAGVYKFDYGTPQCCTGVGTGTPDFVEANVKGPGIDGAVKFDWSEMSPAPTSCAQAESEFTSLWTKLGYTVDENTFQCQTSSPVTPCSVCFQKPDRCIISYLDTRDPWPEGQRFIGYIKCPDGNIFPINPISLAEATGNGWCTYSNINVSLSGPCPSCN